MNERTEKLRETKELLDFALKELENKLIILEQNDSPDEKIKEIQLWIRAVIVWERLYDTYMASPDIIIERVQVLIDKLLKP